MFWDQRETISSHTGKSGEEAEAVAQSHPTTLENWPWDNLETRFSSNRSPDSAERLGNLHWVRESAPWGLEEMTSAWRIDGQCMSAAILNGRAMRNCRGTRNRASTFLHVKLPIVRTGCEFSEPFLVYFEMSVAAAWSLEMSVLCVARSLSLVAAARGRSAHWGSGPCHSQPRRDKRKRWQRPRSWCRGLRLRDGTGGPGCPVASSPTGCLWLTGNAWHAQSFY